MIDLRPLADETRAADNVAKIDTNCLRWDRFR